jgi:7,8-dihydroneopterin aldolase/epimerase/oxygenase
MPDILYVKDLQVKATIGVAAWERPIKQIISIDFEIVADVKKAATNDDIEDTHNYRAISKRLIAYIETTHFNLIETLAERCADIILQEFNVKGVRLRMSKPGAVRFSKDSGVIIERGQWY